MMCSQFGDILCTGTQQVSMLLFSRLNLDTVGDCSEPHTHSAWSTLLMFGHLSVQAGIFFMTPFGFLAFEE